MRINLLSAAIITGLMSGAMAQTQAQKDDAMWLLERLTGVQWAGDSAVVQQAATMVAAGNRNQAAALAVQQPQFLNVVVKNMALEMSTREETIRLPLNDFTATIMGVVRDNTDFREVLYGNFIYVGDPTRIPADIPNVTNDPNIFATEVLESNDHYVDLDSKVRKIDVGASLLRLNTQRVITNIVQTDGQPDAYTLTAVPPADVAGVLTTRTWLGAHAIAGTNRRPFEYTVRQFLCMPIEGIADAGASDLRIGRDIDRFPGGDHMKFQTSCKSCHTVMDGFRGAWAHWDFEGDIDDGNANHAQLRQRNSDNNRVVTKMNRNNTVYPGGYITTNNSWVNNAIRGVNASTMGWRGLDGRTPANEGQGLNQFGRLIANSKRFSTCMAKHAFKAVCRKDLPDTELSVYSSLGDQFEARSYSMRDLFQLAALHPRCK
jgi:hypothetical protein